MVNTYTIIILSFAELPNVYIEFSLQGLNSRDVAFRSEAGVSVQCAFGALLLL